MSGKPASLAPPRQDARSMEPKAARRSRDVALGHTTIEPRAPSRETLLDARLLLRDAADAALQRGDRAGSARDLIELAMSLASTQEFTAASLVLDEAQAVASSSGSALLVHAVHDAQRAIERSAAPR